MSNQVWLGIVLSGALLSGGWAQTRPGTTATARTERKRVAGKTELPPEAKELQAAIAMQQQALAGGDADRVRATSAGLYAVALRQLAATELVQEQASGSARGYGRAIELYRRSLEVMPTVAGRMELAAALLRSGDAKAAADEALTATEMDPESASAWAVRGGALRAAKREKDAVVALRESLRLQPNARVAYALGCALLAEHEREQADAVFGQLLKASGDEAIWYVEVGDAYRSADDLPAAVRAFEEALRRDPRVPHGEFFLGLTYLQMNQWGPNPESFRHLREAVRLMPQDYVSNFYLGALESTAGTDLGSSDRHLRAAAAADGRQPEVWLYLGLNANREHRTEEAKTDLRRAIELTGRDEGRNNYQVRKACFALGRLLVSEGQRAEGQKLLARYSADEQAAVAEAGETIRGRADAANGDVYALATAGGAADAGTQPAGGAVGAAGAGVVTEPGRAAQTSGAEVGEERGLRAREVALRHILATSGNDLGTAEARAQQYDAALATFTEAVQWETPPMPALLRNEGSAAFRLGHFAEAAGALRQYFAREGPAAGGQGGDDRAHVMLAMAEFNQGQFAEAAKAFGAAEAATRGDARTTYSWAYSLAHSGLAQEANRLASELAAGEMPVEQRMLVCHLFVDTEDYAGSAACYRRAYAEDATVRLAHYQVGEALVRMDRAAEALPEYRAELALSPDDPNVQYALAYALLQTSQKAEAQQQLEALTVRHPEQAEAQYQLGKLLLEQGRAAEAVARLEMSEKASGAEAGGTPDYVHYQLGMAYRRVGRGADADRELALYREIKDRKRAGASSHD